MWSSAESLVSHKLWHYSIPRSSLRKSISIVRWWCSFSSSPTATGWCLTFWVSIFAGKGPHFTKNGSPFWQIVTIYLRRSSGVRCFWWTAPASSWCCGSASSPTTTGWCLTFCVPISTLLPRLFWTNIHPCTPPLKVIRTSFLSELIPYCDTRINQDLEKMWQSGRLGQSSAVLPPSTSTCKTSETSTAFTKPLQNLETSTAFTKPLQNLENLHRLYKTFTKPWNLHRLYKTFTKPRKPPPPKVLQANKQLVTNLSVQDAEEQRKGRKDQEEGEERERGAEERVGVQGGWAGVCAGEAQIDDIRGLEFLLQENL